MAKATQPDHERSTLSKSRCPKCGCTDRTPYHGVTERQITGITPDGRRYNAVIWKRTTCRQCGQHRVDRSYEQRKTNTPANENSVPRINKSTKAKAAASPKKSAPKTTARKAKSID